MAKVKLNVAFSKVIGKLNKQDNTIFRQKKYRAETGKVINYGAQEAYEILNPRDYKKDPPKGAELANINSFAQASRLTTRIIQSGKFSDDELAAMSDELREQTEELRRQLAAFKERFNAQLTTPDPQAPILSKTEYPLHAEPPDPLQRPRIKDSLYVGVRAIDGLITLGSGQRIGIMAGSGVGKSTLLSMIARNTEADISVISLVGERGREVRDFIERDLGEEGLKRSVVVVATSDKPALVRIKGAMTATAIAEYFRDQGRRVVLMMDSVTRFAMAQREVGLTIGEPPATRGYTPSVFALLPRLLERAGTSARGSITGIYTVLVDGDDMNEPIADAVRSILDGHIVLSRAIAAQNHFPAIDILASVSRVMTDVVTKVHLEAA